MNVLRHVKPLERSTPVLGAIGLGAVAVLVVASPVQAANIAAGSDYWFTIAGTQFDFGAGIGVVNFIGDPVLAGGTDTQVTRLNDCIFKPLPNPPFVGDSCKTRLEVKSLNLLSAAPVNMGGSLFDIKVSLDPNKRSTGQMKIRHDYPDNGTPAPEGTFRSNFNVSFQAVLTPVGGGASLPPIFDTLRLTGQGLWSHEPPPGAVIVPGVYGDLNANLHSNLSAETNDFFTIGVLKERHPGRGVHVVCSEAGPCEPPLPGVLTPEPSTTLAFLGMGLLSMVGLGKNRQMQKD